MASDAIILAGGLGTRLRPVVADIPKPMAPVLGRPFLEYLLEFWAAQGIRYFHLSVGYLGDRIEAHFGASYLGCRMRYVQESSPLGTGGGLRNALDFDSWESPYAVLMNGDTWFEVGLDSLAIDAGRLDESITVAVKPVQENDRYGSVSLDPQGRITKFGENAPGEGLINGGVYYLHLPRVSELIKRMPPRFSFERDVLVPEAGAGRVAASVQDQTFLDIGVPQDYARAPEILRHRT